MKNRLPHISNVLHVVVFVTRTLFESLFIQLLLRFFSSFFFYSKAAFSFLILSCFLIIIIFFVLLLDLDPPKLCCLLETFERVKSLKELERESPEGESFIRIV